MKLANCTMHKQGDLEDTYRAAVEAVEAAQKAGAEGILIGGRTDFCVYAAIEAAKRGLQVFVTETRAPVRLKSFIDGYYGHAVYVDQPSSS